MRISLKILKSELGVENRPEMVQGAIIDVNLRCLSLSANQRRGFQSAAKPNSKTSAQF